MALDEGDGFEHVFDVAVAPVVAFDLGNGGDVAGAEGKGPGRTCHEHYQAYQEQEGVVCHVGVG